MYTWLKVRVRLSKMLTVLFCFNVPPYACTRSHAYMHACILTRPHVQYTPHTQLHKRQAIPTPIHTGVPLHARLACARAHVHRSGRVMPACVPHAPMRTRIHKRLHTTVRAYLPTHATRTHMYRRTYTNSLHARPTYTRDERSKKPVKAP